MKIIFWGTPKFAVPILEALINRSSFNIVAVVTSPDKPAGRKKIITSPPVKLVAGKYDIPVIQPDKLRNNQEFMEKFKNLNPDICVVAAYGKIIPKEYLKIPKYGFVNIHPSLLPKYRGPTPIQSAILNGDKETGVTIMMIDEEVDHGPILASRELSIFNFQFSNSKELENKLAELGAKLLTKTLPDYISGKIKPEPQNHSQATFTRKFTSEDGRIDWQKTAEKIYNQIRALNPEPGTWTKWDDKRIKILKATLESPDENSSSPGTAAIKNSRLVVKTRRKWLNIEKLQLEGKREMTAREFINGHSHINGAILK